MARNIDLLILLIYYAFSYSLGYQGTCFPRFHYNFFDLFSFFSKMKKEKTKPREVGSLLPRIYRVNIKLKKN